jgi:outer membrane murein-binding lipoprotein Lpp
MTEVEKDAQEDFDHDLSLLLGCIQAAVEKDYKTDAVDLQNEMDVIEATVRALRKRHLLRIQAAQKDAEIIRLRAQLAALQAIIDKQLY